MKRDAKVAPSDLRRTLVIIEEPNYTPTDAEARSRYNSKSPIANIAKDFAAWTGT